jgi:hypothetical protein
MLASSVTTIVRFCTRFPWPIIVLALMAASGSTGYSIRHFAINTDINKLISPDLDWRKRKVEPGGAFLAIWLDARGRRTYGGIRVARRMSKPGGGPPDRNCCVGAI